MSKLVRPAHYTELKKDVIARMEGFSDEEAIGFLLGNAMKYYSRAGLKDGQEILDIDKGHTYDTLLFEKLERMGFESYTDYKKSRKEEVKKEPKDYSLTTVLLKSPIINSALNDLKTVTSKEALENALTRYLNTIIKLIDRYHEKHLREKLSILHLVNKLIKFLDNNGVNTNIEVRSFIYNYFKIGTMHENAVLNQEDEKEEPLYFGEYSSIFDEMVYKHMFVDLRVFSSKGKGDLERMKRNVLVILNEIKYYQAYKIKQDLPHLTIIKKVQELLTLNGINNLDLNAFLYNTKPMPSPSGVDNPNFYRLD